MNRAITVGLSVVAGAALLETALIPGLVIGGAAVLAPKYLPAVRRRLRPLFDAVAPPRRKPAAPAAAKVAAAPEALVAPVFGVKQAIAKTITFRIIVTTLDFSTNLLVIGELGTAAGLSTFNLIAGPLFYFGHEAAWNYLGPAERVDLRTMRLQSDATPAEGGLMISRALAKTITYRTIATVVDFTATYVVVRDLATAAGLTAFGFFVGPFVYLGHERAWEYFTTRRVPDADAPGPAALLPAPG